MTDEKITDLPVAPAAALSDIVYAIQGGDDYQQTWSQVVDLALANIILSYAGNPNTHLAGVLYQLCVDTSNIALYVCTTAGSISTSTWSIMGDNFVLPNQGGTGVSSPTAHTLPVAEGSSNFNFLGPLTNGQLLIGSTGADPTAAALTAGTGITVTNGAGSITITATGGATAWNTVTGTTQSMAVNNGYVANNAGLGTYTLPVTAAIGSVIYLAGEGAGGWIIAQNASQLIRVGSSVTTTGVGGSIASTNRYDAIGIRCTVANTTWVVFEMKTTGFTVV